jgi:diacylglycerol kinase
LILCFQYFELNFILLRLLVIFFLKNSQFHFLWMFVNLFSFIFLEILSDIVNHHH